MGFGRQVHDRDRLMRLKHAVQRGAVADIDLFKRIARAVRNRFQRLQITGIGELVDIHHRMIGVVD